MIARRLLTAAAAIGAALANPAAAQDFAITGATLVIGDGGEPIQNGTVVVQDGRIAAAGAGIAVPAGVPVIDGAGSWVTPGLFSALTDLGLYDISAVGESDDREASNSPFNAGLDVAAAINAASDHIAISRAGGVTRASVTGEAAGSIFAGQGALIDLGADWDAVTKARAFQLVELGEVGGRRAGGSRVAAYTAFRNALAEANELAAAGAQRGGDALLTRPDAAALIPVLRAEQPLYVEVNRAADILSVIALKTEYPRLRLVLVGVAEGWMVAREIAAANIPVITQPLQDLPARYEMLAATQSNAGRMVDAGVLVGFGNLRDVNQPHYSTQQAGNMVALNKIPGATGMTWGEAFAAISSIPARISGMGGEAGILAPGAHGDVVMWDGDPLELSSAPKKVYIDGVEQPLDSHQSGLRERYRDLDESQLPKAYDW